MDLKMIITELESESYGVYNYEAIGIFSPRKIVDSIPDSEESLLFITNWMDKYHPRTFFRGFSYISLGDPKDNFSDSVFLIPSERANREWKERNPEIAKKFKWKELPIGISDKKIEKWQASLSKELILPDYFLRSNSIEELKKQWKIENK